MPRRDEYTATLLDRGYMPGLGEAPVIQAGAPPAAEYYYEPGMLVFQRSLTASQALLDLSQNNDLDADLIWDSIWGTQTGNYTIRLKLPSGRYLSSAQMRNANLVGTAQFPVPMVPAIEVPRNSRIGIDLTDVTAAPNVIEIVFGGLRRYRVN